MISCHLVSVSPATVTFFIIFARFTRSFYVFVNISQGFYNSTAYQNFPKRFIPDVSRRHINARTRLYMPLGIDKAAIEMAFTGKGGNCRTRIPLNAKMILVDLLQAFKYFLNFQGRHNQILVFPCPALVSQYFKIWNYISFTRPHPHFRDLVNILFAYYGLNTQSHIFTGI